jgi:hypothetical protein
MIQDSQHGKSPVEKSRNSPNLQPTLALSQQEVSETFLVLHRDAHQKVLTINSNRFSQIKFYCFSQHSSLMSTIGLCTYLCELAQRSLNPVYLLHAQTAQLMIYAFISYNPLICMSIFETLIPLYEKLTEGVLWYTFYKNNYFSQEKLIKIEPAFGCSMWVLPAYAIVLASIGKFDMSIAIEKRALQLAVRHPEIAGIIYACLVFIRQFRGESLR